MDLIGSISDILWHEYVLYLVLATGVLFTVWSGFSQYRALSLGTRLLRRKHDHAEAPGAISHFQALAAALSATVGLGNIGGVALAVSIGGPGAVFWMWMVGLVGMALKTTEVTLAMLYRNTDDPDNPHGGPMWVAKHGFAKHGKRWGKFGAAVGGIFCITLLVSTVTGGNMFQAWNVGEVTAQNFDVPHLVTGVILAILVGLVIIGGIKRIGKVAGKLVPSMCALYMLAALYVVISRYDQIPAMFKLIIDGAFGSIEAEGAFLGGAFGSAFALGLRRALFSSEAGQGSSPIAHSAVRTNQPASEGLVAGLEPFIDTLVVCTLTALVILSSGAWNRPAEAEFTTPPAIVATVADAAAGEQRWTLEGTELPERETGSWTVGTDTVFMVVRAGDEEGQRGRVMGSVSRDGDSYAVAWGTVTAEHPPELVDPGVYGNYVGAALTSYAFDLVQPGLGMWLVTLAAWLFALSTMISWSYYGEQGMVYLLGQRSVMPYKIIYCLLIVTATAGFVTTEDALDTLTGLGTGVMLFANIPIMWIFGRQAMKALKDYDRKVKAGEIDPS